ncbi:tyrosine-type recombinase/integrase [Streptomyces sp. 3214.6]|uniref:tyrosine-type recombinase/integrase n=1 Tax=Streptomyces sp. 3214.6 TaxID=1882757 RepID=UPI001E53F074|nr:hypothetical protein [Streptomyces sp. 3214.6]
MTPEDIDRVVGDLAVKGRATSTRREYVQIFKGFHRFLQARKAAEIEAAFGVRLVCPVVEFNASRHVGDDSPTLVPPPTPERVAEFFDFMKQRIATARKYGPAARDYALFRTLYHAGLRSEEASLLEKPDVHFTRGPFGKLHVRFGKGAHTSRPRPRWVPMLDGLDLVLRWFLDDVRPKFPDSPVLFADESGGSLHRGTIRNRLRYLMELEGRPTTERLARPAGLTFPQLVRSGELTPSQTRAGLACLRDIIAERGWPPLIWTKKDGYRFCTDTAELQAYELSIVREKLTEIRRFITAVVGPHAALQPKGRWIKHLNTQLGSVESTLDIIAEYINT